MTREDTGTPNIPSQHVAWGLATTRHWAGSGGGVGIPQAGHRSFVGGPGDTALRGREREGAAVPPATSWHPVPFWHMQSQSVLKDAISQ